MDLHTCAVKYMKSCFMLCKHAENQEIGASRYCIVLRSGYICVYFDSFCVLESNRIHPRILSNENTMFRRYYKDRW